MYYLVKWNHKPTFRQTDSIRQHNLSFMMIFSQIFSQLDMTTYWQWLTTNMNIITC